MLAQPLPRCQAGVRAAIGDEPLPPTGTAQAHRPSRSTGRPGNVRSPSTTLWNGEIGYRLSSRARVVLLVRRRYAKIAHGWAGRGVKGGFLVAGGGRWTGNGGRPAEG